MAGISLYFTSIMHRFWDNDVFLQTGNEIMVIPPLGGTVRSARWRILKGLLQVYIHALLTYFTYLQPLMSYSTFSFWLGFPYTVGEICRVFRQNDPQKVKFPKQRTFLRQTASFELSCVEIGSRVLAVRVAIRKIRRHVTPLLHHHVGAPPLIRSQSNLAGLVNRVTQSPLPNFKSNE